jgi:hypothetical protein
MTTLMRLNRVLLIGIGFVIGGCVGYSAATWSRKETETVSVAKSSAASIVYNRGVLDAIEKGDTTNADTTNAVRKLRSKLIAETMMLETCLRELPPTPKYTNLFKIFERSKDKFGSLPSPNDYFRISEVLGNETNAPSKSR